jgi:DNA-binding response OmpR family regulator
MKSEPQPLSHARILVVDDDESVRSGLARALAHQSSFEVETAADAFEAGYRLASFKPDVVLLDVVMPGMGGFDVCERMRRLAETDRLRIVILTGYGGAGNNERSLISGADLFLTKPQDVEVLLMHIEDLLAL